MRAFRAETDRRRQPMMLGRGCERAARIEKAGDGSLDRR
jgi:hypothetical protein